VGEASPLCCIVTEVLGFIERKKPQAGRRKNRDKRRKTKDAVSLAAVSAALRGRRGTRTNRGKFLSS
jgi:hypothetical protein